MTSLIIFSGYSGERLGDRYELIEELGRGSFGVVWKARRIDDKALVALKIPRDQELGEQVLRQEPDLIRAFNHPNIVKIFGIYTVGGLFVIEMELVDGYNLAEILDGISPQRPLSFEQILLWTSQILAGLRTIHSKSIAHSDIKPQNILIDQTGQAKLVDFGTSRRLEDILVWTKRQGTEPYWAPEVAFDERRSLVSDIYSLGVVLYEMVTGQLPYNSPYELLAGRKIQKPSEINSDIPDDLENIILRALARDPGQRYPSCDSMMVDTEEALEKIRRSSKVQKRERATPSRVTFRLDSSSPIYYLDKAKQLLNQGDLTGALSAAQTAVDRSGGHPNYLRLLAGIQMRLGYQRKAMETYEHLLKAYEGTHAGRADQITDVLERLGKLYIALKHYRKAIRIYERLIPLTINKAYARFRLAVAYGLDGHYTKAIELLEIVRHQRPDVPVVYSKLGWAHMSAGNIQQAISFYNQALVLDSGDLFSLFELGQYYLIQGDRRRANSYFDRVSSNDKIGHYKARVESLIQG